MTLKKYNYKLHINDPISSNKFWRISNRIFQYLFLKIILCNRKKLNCLYLIVCNNWTVNVLQTAFIYIYITEFYLLILFTKVSNLRLKFINIYAKYSNEDKLLFYIYAFLTIYLKINISIIKANRLIIISIRINFLWKSNDILNYF